MVRCSIIICINICTHPPPPPPPPHTHTQSVDKETSKKGLKKKWTEKLPYDESQARKGGERPRGKASSRPQRSNQTLQSHDKSNPRSYRSNQQYKKAETTQKSNQQHQQQGKSNERFQKGSQGKRKSDFLGEEELAARKKQKSMKN